MTSLKAADAKDIASSVTALANEKLKAEKEANAGKKKQGKKLDHVLPPNCRLLITEQISANYILMIVFELCRGEEKAASR